MRGSHLERALRAAPFSPRPAGAVRSEPRTRTPPVDAKETILCSVSAGSRGRRDDRVAEGDGRGSPSARSRRRTTRTKCVSASSTVRRTRAQDRPTTDADRRGGQDFERSLARVNGGTTRWSRGSPANITSSWADGSGAYTRRGGCWLRLLGGPHLRRTVPSHIAPVRTAARAPHVAPRLATWLGSIRLASVAFSFLCHRFLFFVRVTTHGKWPVVCTCRKSRAVVVGVGELFPWCISYVISLLLSVCYLFYEQRKKYKWFVEQRPG